MRIISVENRIEVRDGFDGALLARWASHDTGRIGAWLVALVQGRGYVGLDVFIAQAEDPYMTPRPNMPATPIPMQLPLGGSGEYPFPAPSDAPTEAEMIEHEYPTETNSIVPDHDSDADYNLSTRGY